MGLLSKASNIDLDTRLAFIQFIKNNNIKTCAILEKENGIFFIKNSIGFDKDSILASKSTEDFWNGICSNRNLIYNFSKSDNSINCMLQFFSYLMNESLESVSVYRTSDDKILLLINSQINQSIIKDFFKVDNSIIEYSSNLVFNNSNTFHKFEISLDNAFDNYDSISILPIKNEISNQIILNYCNDNLVVRLSTNKIKLCFISNENFNGNIIIQHMKLMLTQIVENEVNKINISYLGLSSNQQEIELFLKVEE